MEDEILLPVGLDTKDAMQDAKELEDYLKNNLGKTGSKGIQLDIKTKGALQELESVRKHIDDIKSNPVQLNIETAEFVDAANKLEEANSKLNEFTAIPHMEEVISTLQDEYSKSVTEQQRLEATLKKLEQAKNDTFMKIIKAEESGDTDKVKALEDSYAGIEKNIALTNSEIQKQQDIFTSISNNPVWKQYEKLGDNVTNAQRAMQKLSADGKQFQFGPDPEKMKQANVELDKVNDKMRVLVAKNKEMQNTATPISGGKNGGGAALAAGFAGATKGATALLGVVKKIAIPVAGLILGVRGLQSILNKIRKGILDGFAVLYKEDKAFKKKIDEVKDSFAEVKTSLALAFQPLVEIAIPYILQVLNWIKTLLGYIAQFTAAITGQNAYTKAIKKTGDAAGAASKQLSKFDELNNLTSGGGGGGSEWDMQKLPIDQKVVDMVEKFKAVLGQIKDIFNELIAIPFAQGFSEAIGDWKSKIGEIKTSILSIGSSLWEIFTDPQVVKAQEEYIKSFSHFLGTLMGLVANAGLNIGMALTGGIAKFFEDHKGEIKIDLTDMFTIADSVFDNLSDLAISLSQIIDTIGESETLKETISNLIGTVYELYMAIEMVALKLLDTFSGTIAQTIKENIDGIKGALEGVFGVLSKVSGFLQQVATTVRNIVTRLVDDVITPLVGYIQPVLSQIISYVLDLWATIQPVLTWLMDEISELWSDYVEPVLNDVIDLVSVVGQLVGEIITATWDKYVKPFLDLIMTWMPTILSTVKITFDAIFFIIQTLMILLGSLLKAVGDVVKFVLALIKGDWKGAWEAARKFVEDLFFAPVTKIWDAFTTYFEKCIGHYKELLVNIAQAVVRTGEFLVNALVSLINDSLIKIVNAATSALNYIPGVDIPAVPEIPKVSWSKSVPALAQGAVIPPSMGEFIAKLGDNNQETEIVSPLSTMKQALMEALQESGGGAGGEIHVHVDLDGREIAKAVVRQNDIYKKSSGRTLFA